MSGRELPTLEPGTSAEWRAWLEKNHASSAGVWLRIKRKGVPGRLLTREKAWEEALCFGWIDSLIRKVDEDRFDQKFTPRKKGSNWSQINLKKVEELRAQGRMREGGIAALEQRPPTVEGGRPNELSPQTERIVRENDSAWQRYQDLPIGERLNYIHWIMEAKREETRNKRAREAALRLAEGKRLGLK
ncbi:MAG: YdeI/OmpD-associated family protein [Methanomassiliicoccales archaeon]|nr:YdeI/OmpD-associated family protein [Methanomassiliicoccales archaeon]